MSARLGLVVVGGFLLGTARCPVSCSRRQPPRSTYAPEVEIPMERSGPCEFRLLGEVPRAEGVTAVNLRPPNVVPPRYWRIDGGVLSITSHDWCPPDGGLDEVSLVFYEVVRVGGPD